MKLLLINLIFKNKTMTIIKKELEAKLQTFLESKETQKAIKEIKQDEKDYIIKFKLTNESVDRDWEILKSGGWDWSFFDKNPVILINHSYKVESIAWKAIKRETIWTETYITVQLAKWVEAWELVKTLHSQWMIKWVSIWFIPLERDKTNSKIITKWEALEWSFVPIGSNRDALIEDAKTLKKCVDLWMFKEIVEEKEKTLEVWQNIAFRNIYKTTNDKWEEVERIYPLESELPRLGKIIAIYDNQDLLQWNELVSWTKENPYLVIQNYIKSKKWPILLTTSVETCEYESIRIEQVINQKSIEDWEVKFSNVEKEKIDTSKVFDNMKIMSDDIKFIKSQIKTFFDDKKKEKNISKIRDLGKELQKSLSALNEEAKSQK